MERSFTWLRPGGRLVIGDMMFGRGADAADREIIRAKIRSLIGQARRVVANHQERLALPTSLPGAATATGRVGVDHPRRGV